MIGAICPYKLITFARSSPAAAGGPGGPDGPAGPAGPGGPVAACRSSAGRFWYQSYEQYPGTKGKALSMYKSLVVVVVGE